MRGVITTLLVATCYPAAVFCQNAPSTPLSRADVTASIGWFDANRSVERECCGWSASLFKGLSGGYYWTDHLKTELEAAWPGPTEGYGGSTTFLPNGRYTYTSEEHTFHDAKFSASQVYQFGRNAMFHPFVFAGVDVDRERDAISAFTYTSYAGSQDTQKTRTETRTVARPFTGVGFKAYFSDRAFFRGEAKFDFASGGVDQIVWKAGIGIDLPGTRRVAAAANARPAAAVRTVPRGQDPPELWRQYAAKLKVGSVLDVVTVGGGRFTAFLIAANEAGITVQPRTRVAEPVHDVPYDRIEYLALQTGTSGATRVGAIAAGTGTGCGVFMMLLLLALSSGG